MDNVDRLHADLGALRDELNKVGVHNARIEERLKAVEEDVRVMATGAERFVLRSAFEPYRQIMVSMIVLLLGGLVTLGFSFLGGGR